MLLLNKHINSTFAMPLYDAGLKTSVPGGRKITIKLFYSRGHWFIFVNHGHQPHFE